VVAGEKVQPVARKVGVHRTFIYIWKERALSALEEALEPHKRGPKFKHPQKNLEEALEPHKRGPKFKHPQKNLEEKLKEEVDKLKACLEEREKPNPFSNEKIRITKITKGKLRICKMSLL